MPKKKHRPASASLKESLAAVTDQGNLNQSQKNGEQAYAHRIATTGNVVSQPIDGLDEIDGEADDEWREATYRRFLLRLWYEGKWEPAMGALPVDELSVDELPVDESTMKVTKTKAQVSENLNGDEKVEPNRLVDRTEETNA